MEGGMPKKALIVGGTGFVGAHLRTVLEPAWTVALTGRACDVRDVAALRVLIGHERPDAVVNLAAVTTVRETVEDPRTAYATIADGAANLVAVLKAEGFAGRLLQVSSSEVYGRPDVEDLPLMEDAPLRPSSPYAFAKLMAEHAALGSGLDAMVIRPFTHIGPGQAARFAIARFARDIAAIEAGLEPPVLRVGGLSATRDLTDVRDVARAYALMLERGRQGGLYNVCSGVETPMRGVLDALLALSPTPIAVEADAELVRDGDVERLCGSAARLSTDTGWAPEIALSRTLADVLEDARKKARP
jgi:GDP-4-dehydro-6-deoxy-D-mannose reductase